MTETLGLSDKNMALMAMIFGVFFAVQSYLAGLPEVDRPPQYVFVIMGVVGAAILPIKNLLGVRDASTSRIAKVADPTLHQNRAVTHEQLPGGLPNTKP